MNAYLRTLPLPGAVRPVREHGASALDRAVTVWPAPDAAARVLDHWGGPIRPAAARACVAPWPAPDPLMRFDLPTPPLHPLVAPIDGRIPWTNLVEPRSAVRVPDLQSASRAAVTPPTEAIYGHCWPAPTLADAAPIAQAESGRRGISTRVVIGLAVAAGTLAAGATALISLF